MKKSKTIKIGSYDLTEDQFYGKEKIGGYLDLRSLTSIPDGFNPTVGGYLDLSSLTSIPDGFNPTVGGYLDLSSLTSIPDGFNPTVGGYLDLRSLTSIPDGFNPTVGGYLYLSSLTSIPDGFNPTVGGSLDLSSLTSIPDGFNPTVGGYLDLSSLRGKAPDYTHLSENTVLTWLSGKYLKVDEIFVEVVSQRGHVWHVKKLNSDKIFYLATDGNGKYSHGDTLKDAKDSLIYKITNRDKSRYEKLNINSVLSLSEMIECYRVITGACEFGVKDFIKTTCNNKPKKEYSIKEIIKITQNAFGGNTFKSFFKLY